MPGTTPVAPPPTPTPLALRSVQTGRPVSSKHGERWNHGLLFQSGYCLEPVFSDWFPNTSSSTDTIVVGYKRSPYAQVLLIQAELWDATAGDTVKIGIKVNGSSATLVGRSSLDGTTTLYCPSPNRRESPVYEQYIDISGLSTSGIHDIEIKWTSIVGGKGLCHLHVTEVPLSDSNTVTNPTTEPGVNGSWVNPPNTLIDGSSTTSTGFVRLLAQYDTARTGPKRHRQLATYVSTTRALTVTGTSFVVFTWPDLAGGYDPKFYARAVRFYETSTPEPLLLSCYYRADAGGTLRIDVNGTTTDLTLGATAGSFQRSATTSVSLPCNTTDLEVGPIIFKAKSASATNDDTHNVFVSNIFLHSNEP